LKTHRLILLTGCMTGDRSAAGDLTIDHLLIIV
jgi:hypothetical protein